MHFVFVWTGDGSWNSWVICKEHWCHRPIRARDGQGAVGVSGGFLEFLSECCCPARLWMNGCENVCDCRCFLKEKLFYFNFSAVNLTWWLLFINLWTGFVSLSKSNDSRFLIHFLLILTLLLSMKLVIYCFSVLDSVTENSFFNISLISLGDSPATVALKEYFYIHQQNLSWTLLPQVHSFFFILKLIRHKYKVERKHPWNH